jgi:hypothetical protein
VASPLIIVVRVVKGVQGLPSKLGTLLDGVFVRIAAYADPEAQAVSVIQSATRRAGARG